MTRKELGQLLAASTPTRTLKAWTTEDHLELAESWEVVLIEANADHPGVIDIYCEAPKS